MQYIMQCSAFQCIVRFLWSSAKIGGGRMLLREFFLHRFNLLQPEPTASVSQLCKAASQLFQREAASLSQDGWGWVWTMSVASREASHQLEGSQSRSGGRTGRTNPNDAANCWWAATLILGISDISCSPLNHHRRCPIL